MSLFITPPEGMLSIQKVVPTSTVSIKRKIRLIESLEQEGMFFCSIILTEKIEVSMLV